MTETRATPDWRDGFLFLGNQLALDFLNTRPILNGETTELLPNFSALLNWFQAAELLSRRDASRLRLRWEGSVRAQRTIEAMHEFREQLRNQVLSWERDGAVRHSTVSRLNRLLAERPMLTRVKLEGAAPVTKLWFDVRKPEDLFAPLAHSATSLFTDADRSRVRKCANCVGHFLDTSKKGTRRWCSMQLCGNRAKVAAYAARRRTA
jgi:predicted RNA-binding Zn ribbon-like protein